MAKAKASSAKKAKEEPKKTKSSGVSSGVTIERRLTALFKLQLINTKVDKIRMVRGELPLEVQDLEDEIGGLETRITKYEKEVEQFTKSIEDKKVAIKNSNELIKKYEGQQMNVRNNREYESLSKEIEFQKLEIELSEKRINEYKEGIKNNEKEIEISKAKLEERKQDLEAKKNELDDIIADTEKEEKELLDMSKENETIIEDRLLTAYKRIRKNARNGLAVVTVERDACGGCFNKIPPQRQLDIRMHKKIIVCEYCGRILVDENIRETASKEIS